LDEQGGAIYASGGYTNVFVENSVFLDNDAEGDGGAIYLDDSVLILSGGNLFQGNSTEEDGGAIYGDTVLGSGKDIFINNSAAIDGGAISSRTIEIQNKFFGENTAGEWGGALIGSFVNVVNSTFFNNQAGDEGGAIWSAGLLGEGDTVQNSIAMNTFLVNRVGNEGSSVGLSIYTTGKMNLFGNIFASNDSPQSHLEVGGGEGAPEFIDLGANYFTSQGDTDVLTAESSRLVTFSELTIVQGPVVDNTDSIRTFVAPITTDSLASDAIDTTEFAATLTALGLNGEITDQRGVVRTGKYDAGAFEVGDTTYRKPQIDQQADQVVIAPKVVLPSAPATVNIKAEGRKAIRVNWTAPKTTGTGKILRYEIYRNGKKVATLPASARTYLDRNLDSRQSYTYRIVTVGSQGNSVKSLNTKSIFPRR
jgi:predicted outer membrane repeat protein